MGVPPKQNARRFRDPLDEMEVTLFAAAVALNTSVVLLLVGVDAGREVLGRVQVALPTDRAHRGESRGHRGVVPVARRAGRLIPQHGLTARSHCGSGAKGII